MNNTGTFSKLSPERLLRQLTNSSDTTCLQVLKNSVLWSIYLEKGKIIYATHTVEPFDRLERHIRRLNPQIPLVTNEVRVQLRMRFEPDWYTQLHETDSGYPVQAPEYQAIHWLLTEKYLSSYQAALLIQELVKEVIESFLLIREGTYELTSPIYHLPRICKLDAENIMERCYKRLQNWQSFAPQISSPYQRPYLLINRKLYDQQLPELEENITTWMKGFSLRHLAVIINVDEVELARTLYPHILQGSIILHQPDPPFDQLPQTCEEISFDIPQSIITTNGKSVDIGLIPKPIHEPETLVQTSSKNGKIQPVTTLDNDKVEVEKVNTATITTDNGKVEAEKLNTANITAKKTYKIISVDDSPTILKEISRCLQDEDVAVVTINDPVKAVMSIIRHKPDLILLDLNMAGIDGYELCRIIRNNSMFKEVPIIFVTGNKGIVDKVKARMVGASGYLTKPFTRTELLKIIFMHLA